MNKLKRKLKVSQSNSEQQLEQAIVKPKKAKLTNECVKTVPNSPCLNNDNYEKRPHSSISLPPPPPLISNISNFL